MPRSLALASLALTFLLLAAPSLAQQTISVTMTYDVVDFGGAQQVADLPGPDGEVSFREAVIAANNTAGPQTIGFHIPLSDPLYRPTEGVFWLFFDLFPNTVTITDDGTTVDGATQTAFTGDTNPHGPEIVFLHCTCASSVPSIIIESDDNVIREVTGPSLSVTSYEINGDRNRLEGTIAQGLGENVLITGADNVIGGTAPGAGNRISGGITALLITGPGATGNVVKGNRITNGHENGVVVSDGASNNVIGGAEAGARNVIVSHGHASGEGNPVGTAVSISGSGNVFEGNYVGVTEDGSSAAGLAARGVSVGGTGNRVGGTAPGAGNVIGGFSTYDSEARYALIAGGVGTVVQGNVIGVDPVGQQPRPSTAGIFVSGTASGVVVGGTDPGAGNVVAHSETYGIGVNGPSANAALLGNVTFSNGGLGIDLGVLGFSDGPTPNDPNDADEGPNRYQNFPVITSATLGGSALTVTYAVDTAPANATYPLRVEFFRAGAGGDEGQVFLGADTYTAADYDAGMPGTKTVTLDVGGLSEGDLVLATATDGAGNTSEFGAPEAVTGGGCDAELTAADLSYDASTRRLTVQVTARNNGASPFGARLELDYTRNGGAPQGTRVLGQGTLPAGATVSRTITLRVPAGAPDGSYSFTLRLVDVNTGSDCDDYSETIAISAPRLAGDAVASELFEVEAAADLTPTASALTRTTAAVAPNPFARQTSIRYEVAATADVRLAVYDVLGREVAVLVDGRVEEGRHAATFDARGLSAGTYVYRLQVGDEVQTGRMTLAR